MKPDICIPCGEGLVNLRVGAIIMKNGKLLAVGTVEELNERAETNDFETAFVSIVKDGAV